MMSNSRKVSVIGAAGNIGSTIVYNLVMSDICDEIVACDISSEVATGRTLDILQSMTVFNKKTKITPTSDYSEIAGSKVVIVPAGFPRKPGMTRDDLLVKNISIIKTVAESIKKYAPDAFVIIITNPLDLMVLAAHKILKGSKHKIVGMAGVLDSARLKYQVSQLMNVNPDVVNPMVIGAHNDFMVPLLRYTTIYGMPLTQFIRDKKNQDDKLVLTHEEADNIIEKVRKGGAEIVKYLGNGSAFYGPATSAVLMADCILNDKKRVLSCSAYLEGEYGVDGLFVGAPVLLGKNGVEKIVEVELNEEERKEFDKSVDSIRDAYKDSEKIINESIC